MNKYKLFRALAVASAIASTSAGLTAADAQTFDQAFPHPPTSSAAASPAAAGTTAQPAFGVYRWGAANKTGGAKANVVYSQWLNRPLVWAEDFEPTDQWENNIEGGGWQLGEWRDWKKALPGRRLVLSVPLLPGDWNRHGAKGGAEKGQPVSWTAAANGDYTEHFTKLAQNLVQYGLGDSIVRLGWEFNGGWYTFRASDNPKAFAKYWGLVVTAMRAVPGAEKMQFCWNPASASLQFPAEQAWPGDEFVDIVGVDLYDQSWAKDTYPLPANGSPEEILKRQQKAWNDVLCNGDHGLMFWKKFADAHHKPLSIPEWGVCQRGDKHGGNDNPYFVEQMSKFILDPANHVAFHCYFDVWAGDGNHQLSPGIKGTEVTKFPQSLEMFRKYFAGTAPAAASTTTPAHVLTTTAPAATGPSH